MKTLRKNRFVESTKPEAPEDAPLGKFAFPSRRQGVFPAEADTEVEKNLYTAIGDHLVNTYLPLTVDDAKLMMSFLDDDLYKDVFHEPWEGSAIYRGMGVTEEWLRMIIGDEIDENTSGQFFGSFVFKPRAGCSSWTTSKGIAQRFAGYNKGVMNNFSVILNALPSKNPKSFIIGDEGFYKVKYPKYVMQTEEEVIGLLDIKVSMIEWEKNKS